MTTTTNETSTFGGKTAQQWREAASASAQRANESWERSDTDGFMSQWASGVMQGRYLENAQIAEAGGRIEIVAPFDLDGNLIHARYIEARYGWCWMVLDERGQRTGVYLNESSARKGATRMANNRKKGFALGLVTIPVRFNSHEGRADLGNSLVDPATAIVIETETILTD